MYCLNCSLFVSSIEEGGRRGMFGGIVVCIEMFLDWGH